MSAEFRKFGGIMNKYQELDIDREQGAQGLKAFAFCEVTLNDEHTKPRFKRKRRGKYKDGICRTVFKALV